MTPRPESAPIIPKAIKLTHEARDFDSDFNNAYNRAYNDYNTNSNIVSTGAIVGIVFGVLFFLTIILFAFCASARARARSRATGPLIAMYGNGYVGGPKAYHVNDAPPPPYGAESALASPKPAHLSTTSSRSVFRSGPSPALGAAANDSTMYSGFDSSVTTSGGGFSYSGGDSGTSSGGGGFSSSGCDSGTSSGGTGGTSSSSGGC